MKKGLGEEEGTDVSKASESSQTETSKGIDVTLKTRESPEILGYMIVDYPTGVCLYVNIFNWPVSLNASSVAKLITGFYQLGSSLGLEGNSLLTTSFADSRLYKMKSKGQGRKRTDSRVENATRCIFEKASLTDKHSILIGLFTSHSTEVKQCQTLIRDLLKQFLTTYEVKIRSLLETFEAMVDEKQSSKNAFTPTDCLATFQGFDAHHHQLIDPFISMWSV